MPAREQIESSAAETIDHLEIDADVKNGFAHKFINLWLHLFISSAQYNRSLRLLLNSQDFPTERDLRQYEAGLEEAAEKQFDSCILLANLFQNEEIYPGLKPYADYY